MLAGMYVKNLRKNPPDDESLAAALTSIRDILDTVLTGEPPAEPTTEELADAVEGLVKAAVDGPLTVDLDGVIPVFEPAEEAATA